MKKRERRPLLKQQHKILISGGGTGGHIFPAIAIANAYKKRHPLTEILFVGAQNRMEMDLVPKAGYPIKGLWISGFQRKLSLANLSFPFKLISSLMRASSIINTFKPDIVIGVGGYASGPTLRMATRKKIPTLIQEQNAFPGITNRLLASKVSTICVAYDGMNRYFPQNKIVLTGNPIREHVIQTTGKKEKAIDYFSLDGNKKTLLVIGGSQGARSINLAIMHNIKALATIPNIQIIWQTGKQFIHEAENAINIHNINNITPCAFIHEMDLAYAAADIVLSRAGAIAISELCAVGKPVLFIPLPTAAEDHQRKNAEALVAKNAAHMIIDSKVQTELVPAIEKLFSDYPLCNQLSKNIKALAKTNAADAITLEIEKLINRKLV